MSDLSLPQRPSVGLPEPRFRSLRIIAALMLREAGSTYGRSPGGYLWAVIAPVGMICFLTFGFSLMLRSPGLGTSFVLFYATGFLPFGLYNELQGKISGSLGYSRRLIAYPGVSWLHALIARFLLNGLTQLTVFCVVIIGILSFVETRTIIDIRPILKGLAMAAIIGLSVGMVNCLLIGMFQVWSRIWGILSRPLFFASGVFYIYEDMPEFAQDILWFNPIIHAVGSVRAGFYPTYHPSYISGTYVFGLTMTAMALSILLLRRYYRRVLEK